MTRRPALQVLTLACTLAAVAFTPDSGRAQSIVGVVVDDQTGDLIEGARVSLVDPVDQVVRETLSDRFGSFRLETSGDGPWRLRVARIGYAEYESEVLDLERGATQLRIRLGTQAIPLEPLEVLARAPLALGPLSGFEERIDDPTLAGFYLTKEDIEHRPLATPIELLRQFPGADVRGGGTFGSSLVYLRGPVGPCLAETYVNGMRVEQSAGRSLDDLLITDQISGVEFYPRPALAPAQYGGNGQCGVVLYWMTPPDPSDDSGWARGRLIAGGALMLGILALVLGS